MEREISWLLAEKYGGAESQEFKSDVGRLARGEPLAYIIGWVPFLGTKIWLDSKPLIPRPETEYWVEKVITEIKQRLEVEPRVLRILDLCAGSGCIGVAILKTIPGALVDFVEIEKFHHNTIHKNILENGIDIGRTKIYSGSIFENVAGKYDVILTNPPYIDSKLSERISKSVLEHEPQLALFGGSAGMEIIERIIREVPNYLNSGGILYIEHEPEQTEKIKNLAPNTLTFEDQYGILRYSRISFQ